MRIALDATYSVDPHPSGIAIYSQEIMRGLAALHETDEFFHCYRLKQWRQRAPVTLPNVRSRILQRPLPIGRPQIFHALNQRLDWRPSKHVVTTFHDLFVMTADYSSPEYRQRFSQQARRAAERSDAIIAVSHFTAGQVRDLLGVPASRIRVIPHGVHQLRIQHDLPRERIVLFVGTLQRRKNIIGLVQGFEHMPSNWKLVLAGAPGGYGSVEIMEYIDRSACRDRIQVAGYLSNEALQRLYARAAIFAFPSLDEGFGIPVLEAMASGLPVVTSNRSALCEVVGEAALVVDPESSEQIGEALVRLAEDPELRASLGERGKLHTRQFCWSDAVATTHQLYQELANTNL